MYLEIISIFFSIISIFFYIFPYIKTKIINNIKIKIDDFFKFYRLLNPWLNNAYIDSEIEILKELKKQCILYYFLIDFPFWNNNLKNNYLSLYLFKEILQPKKITISQIIYFFIFWKNILKKIKYISNVLNNYNYLVKFKDDDLIWYNLEIENEIEITSISLCPSFDEIKSHKLVFLKTFNLNEDKSSKINIDFKSIMKNNKKRFINELKSNLFSINLLFKSKIKDKFFSYVIYFKDMKPYKIETWFHKNISKINTADKETINYHFSIIKNCFGICPKKITENCL